MTTRMITRQEMSTAMHLHYNADIVEPPKHDWRRIGTTVVAQGNNVVEGEAIDFHLIELCLEGSHHIRAEGELEGKESITTALQPGAIAYVQNQSALFQQVEGSAKLQQLYIENAVFEEVAVGIAPGDPATLKPLGMQGVFDPRIKKLMATILEEARAGAPGGELFADLLAQQIALLILRRGLGDRETKSDVRPLSDFDIARVIDFMEANLEEVGGMGTLARQIDMDVFAFTRAFKAKTGEAPHQFLIGRRLAHVKDMLLNTKMPLAEISYAAGFSNQSHMTTTFSKHFGMPPGAWRKMVRS